MKTPHRIMYEVLSKDEYKKFCANVNEGVKRNVYLMLQHDNPRSILMSAFVWEFSLEGNEYWFHIGKRLV